MTMVAKRSKVKSPMIFNQANAQKKVFTFICQRNYIQPHFEYTDLQKIDVCRNENFLRSESNCYSRLLGDML